MREKEKNMAKKNYYAVKQGKVPGIYRTWDACKAQVHGYPGAIYKGFERLEEAEAFLGGGKMPEPLLRETKGTYFQLPGTKGSTEHGSTRSFFLGLGTPDSGGKTMRRPGIRRCRQERRRIRGWKLSACARKVLLRCGPPSWTEKS